MGFELTNCRRTRILSALEGRQVLTQRAKQVANLMGRIKLAEFMSLPEDEARRIDSLLNKLRLINSGKTTIYFRKNASIPELLEGTSTKLST